VEEAIERHGGCRMATVRGRVVVRGCGGVRFVEFVDGSVDGLASWSFGLGLQAHGLSRVPGFRVTCRFLGDRDQHHASRKRKQGSPRLRSRLPFRTVALRATSWDRWDVQLFVYLRQKKLKTLPPSSLHVHTTIAINEPCSHIFTTRMSSVRSVVLFSFIYRPAHHSC
jgi:hypothetical protein